MELGLRLDVWFVAGPEIETFSQDGTHSGTGASCNISRAKSSDGEYEGFKYLLKSSSEGITNGGEGSFSRKRFSGEGVHGSILKRSVKSGNDCCRSSAVKLGSKGTIDPIDFVIFVNIDLTGTTTEDKPD